MVMVMIAVEIKYVEEIADGRAVERDVGIVVVNTGVREIVPACLGQRFQAPVPLDELQDRNVVGIGVVDMPTLAEGRDDDQWNTRAVAEEIERLNVARVVIAAAFVEGDDQSSALEQFGVGLEVVNDFIDHTLEQIELRRSRVTVEQSIRLDEGDGRERAVVD